jgi:hypothetical protein
VPVACGSGATPTRFGSTFYSQDEIELSLRLISECGGTLVRLGLDGYSLDRPDAVFPVAASFGLRVILISKYAKQPVDVRNYARECAAVHARYAKYDPIWEVWNEPNLPQYWGASPNVAAYAGLAVETAKALRGAGARDIWTGGTSGIDVRWVQALKLRGTFDVMNGCAVHSYKTPSAAFGEYYAVRAVVPDGIHIHTTETCVPSTQDQSAFMREMWYIHRTLALPTMIWCELRDFTAGNDGPYAYPYGLLYSTYRPKASYYAAQTLVAQCEMTPPLLSAD